MYLPEKLASSVKPLGLNLSQVLQAALRAELAADRLSGWLRQLDDGTDRSGAHAALRGALESLDPDQPRG